MQIKYLGHASFKLMGKNTTVVTDPYSKRVGFEMPKVSADIVTISHNHFDHNQVDRVKGTARRQKPFVIREPGEYEIGAVSVFGYRTWHDDKEGQERGENIIYVIEIDEVRVLHLGDLGHKLTKKLVNELGEIDVVLVPVGGVYTIGPKAAKEVVEEVGAEIIIPMHYKTERHSEDFKALAAVEEFLQVMGVEARRVKNQLTVSKLDLSGEGQEVVVFEE